LRHTVPHDGFQIGHELVPTSRGRRDLCKSSQLFQGNPENHEVEAAGRDYGNRSDYTRARGKSKPTRFQHWFPLWYWITARPRLAGKLEIGRAHMPSELSAHFEIASQGIPQVSHAGQ
jgi:hypothetical protein